MISKKHIIKSIDTWISDNIPGFSFREHQEAIIIDTIYNVLNPSKNSTQIIEAPTGSGKSIIATICAGVLSKHYNKVCYILCSDLFLWKQYADFIKAHKIDFGMLKGQTGNYNCLINNEDIRNSTCRMANIPWKSLFSKEKSTKLGFECAKNCEYVKARKKAISSKCILATYQLFLYMFNNVPNCPLKVPDVLICDECHNIPEIVQKQCSPTIKEDDFKHMGRIYEWAQEESNTLFSKGDFELLSRYKDKKALMKDLKTCFKGFCDPNKSVSDNVTLINIYDGILNLFSEPCEKIEKAISELFEQKRISSKEDLELYKHTSFYRNYMCFWHDFLTALEDSKDKMFVKNISGDPNDKQVVFNCTKEDIMVWKYLFSHASSRILMSATIGNKDVFDDNTGMKYSEDKKSNLMKIPSTFDFSKSPIYVLDRFKMSYGEKETSFKEIKKYTYSLIKRYQGVKGMIHTGSYDNAIELYKSAPNDIKDRMLLYSNSKEKDEMIDFHRTRKDTIIVGPTLNEGVDLPGDGCRFMIIIKVPYPSLSDKLVEAKKNIFPNWYNSKTSNSVIQSIGRGNRTPNDWCVTYILDACFVNLFNRTKDQYSRELINRIKFFK